MWLADALDARLVGARGPGPSGSAAARRPATSPASPAARGAGRVEPGMDLVEAAGQPPTVAVERPAAEPGVAGPPVPGDDPVVEREPERRQVLVVGRDRRQPLEDVAPRS